MPKPIQDQKNKNTQGFDKHPENIGNGRPLKIYTVLKHKGYSKDDIGACFGELLYYSKNELEKLILKNKVPAISLIIAKHLIKAIEHGMYEKGVMDMLNRFSGMPTQKIEVGGVLSQEEMEEQAKLTKKYLDDINKGKK